MPTVLAPALALATALALIPLSAGAASCVGVDFPDQIDSGGETLVLNGLGLRQATVFKVDVYVAALYLPTKLDDPEAIVESESRKELVLRFVRDVDRKNLAGAWRDGFDNNAGDLLPAIGERVTAFVDMMDDVAEGQSMRFVLPAGGGVAVDIDGQVRGTVEGTDFARALLSIWFGPRPPDAGLKAGLLGGRCE